MRVFADSSALVKLYADESGHHEIRGFEGLIVSTLARVEVPAALWRKARLGKAQREDVGHMVRRFETDFHGFGESPPRFGLVDAAIPVLASAARTTASFGLRGYDAVQLAGALAARDADPACTTFACFDRELRTAAATNGFELIPATL